MQIYDTIVLLIILIAAFFGWRKGLATQIASIVSIAASYLVAVNFRSTLAAHIDASPPWNTFASMLILYLGTSIVIWLLFRQVRSTIEAMKLGEFDQQMGALFGAAKGFLIACIITLFTVTLLKPETMQDTIIGSRSGYLIASFLNRAESVMPAELHRYVGPYLDNLDAHMGTGQPTGYPGQPAPYPGQQPPQQYGGQPGYSPTPTTYPQQPGTYPQQNYPSGTYPPATNYGSQPQPYTPPTAPAYQPPGNWATPAAPAVTPRY